MPPWSPRFFPEELLTGKTPSRCPLPSCTESEHFKSWLWAVPHPGTRPPIHLLTRSLQFPPAQPGAQALACHPCHFLSQGEDKLHTALRVSERVAVAVAVTVEFLFPKNTQCRGYPYLLASPGSALVPAAFSPLPVNQSILPTGTDAH